MEVAQKVLEGVVGLAFHVFSFRLCVLSFCCFLFLFVLWSFFLVGWLVYFCSILGTWVWVGLGWVWVLWVLWVLWLWILVDTVDSVVFVVLRLRSHPPLDLSLFGLPLCLFVSLELLRAFGGFDYLLFVEDEWFSWLGLWEEKN